MVRLALEVYQERYGTYPLFLYGGDSASTFTTSGSFLDPGPYPGYNGRPEGQSGDRDPLLDSGILQAYPLNPFSAPELFVRGGTGNTLDEGG